MTPVETCKAELEAAIGECEAILSEATLTATIHYLTEYQRLEFERSWIVSPERMGR